MHAIINRLCNMYAKYNVLGDQYVILWLLHDYVIVSTLSDYIGYVIWYVTCYYLYETLVYVTYEMFIKLCTMSQINK